MVETLYNYIMLSMQNFSNLQVNIAKILNAIKKRIANSKIRIKWCASFKKSQTIVSYTSQRHPVLALTHNFRLALKILENLQKSQIRVTVHSLTFWYSHRAYLVYNTWLRQVFDLFSNNPRQIKFKKRNKNELWYKKVLLLFFKNVCSSKYHRGSHCCGGTTLASLWT